MSNYVPRFGTRARAVFDLLQDGKEHRWKELFTAYQFALDPPSNEHYISLTLGRLLKKIATRVQRGVYVRRLMDKMVRFEDLPKIDVVHDQGPEPEVDENPFGRRFKPGDRVRYKGGYTHFDHYGVPVGSVWTVDFYGSASRPVIDQKGFLWFKEPRPGATIPSGGHSDDNFELVIDHGACPVEASVADYVSEEMHLEAMSLKDAEIKSLQDRLTEAAVKINGLERENAQIEQVADRYQEDYYEGRQSIESMEIVIKNQLELIGRLDAKLFKIQAVLDGKE